MLATLAVAFGLMITHPGASAPAGPEPLTPALRDSVRASIEKDRHDTGTWLASGATSYLATVLRVDFGEASRLTIGRAADCGVRIDDPAMPEHALAVSVEGDSFRVAALAVSVEGDSFRVAALGDTASFRWKALAYRSATLPPSSIEFGRWTLRLSHQRFPAIIVFDPKSPRYALYHGLAYYPVDLGYRIVAPLIPAEHPDTVIILSTRGNSRRALRVGWFDLDVAGHRCRLEAHRLLEPGADEHGVSVFFRDATSGTETYGVGRYVDPERLPDGRWRIDFNSAYNPACAFSLHYNCPIPSRANTLKFALRAGEKDSHYAAH